MKLISKRNRVYLEDNKINKHFEDENAAQNEAAFLDMLSKKGVSVPIVLGINGNILTMEYIKGTTLPDLLCGPVGTDWRQIADAVTNWLLCFYHAVNNETTGEIRGDINGRNFIFHDGRVWSVDFEEHCYGIRETDAGRMLAYIKTYDTPRETDKTALAESLEKCFCEILKLDMEKVLSECEKELQAIAYRRNL